MPKTITTPWDPADHLETEEDRAAYLEAALEEGDPNLIAAALEDIARAEGMMQKIHETKQPHKKLGATIAPDYPTP